MGFRAICTKPIATLLTAWALMQTAIQPLEKADLTIQSLPSMAAFHLQPFQACLLDDCGFAIGIFFRASVSLFWVHFNIMHRRPGP